MGDALGVGDVRLDNERSSARTLAFMGHRGQRLAAAPRQHQVSAGGGERLRGRAPDAAGCAGNHHTGAREIALSHPRLRHLLQRVGS
jgi:hypothetical protein